MLVLSRKNGERIRIDENIEVVVLKAHRGSVRLGFCCPPDVPIHREEIYQRIQAEQRDSAEAARVA